MQGNLHMQITYSTMQHCMHSLQVTVDAGHGHRQASLKVLAHHFACDHHGTSVVIVDAWDQDLAADVLQVVLHITDQDFLLTMGAFLPGRAPIPADEVPCIHAVDTDINYNKNRKETPNYMNKFYINVSRLWHCTCTM